MANSKDNYNHISSYLGFDETYGEVVDIITGFKGALVNNPPRVNGWNGVGKAIQFNGSNQYILMNNPLIPLGDKSIRLKFKKNIAYCDNDVLFCTAGTSDASHNGFYMTIYADELMFIVSNAGATTTFSVGIVDDMDWHDCLVTVEGKIVKTYLDGILTNEYDNYTENFTTQKYNLYIGAYHILGTYNFNGIIDQIEIYDRAISPIPDKYLVFHDNQYKYHDGTSWQTCTDSDDNYIQFGHDNLSHITESQWNELVGEKSLKMWTDYENKQFAKATLIKEPFTIKELLDTSPKVVYYNTHDNPTDKILQFNAQPKPQLVKSKTDILIAGVESLDKIVINGTGDIKTSISFDSGVTEYAYRNGGWVQIQNAHDGMIISELTSLTNDELSVLRDKSNFVRFNYSLTGDAELTSVQMYVKLDDTISIADSNAYDLSYDQATKTITYDIKKVGKYFVNYVT